MTGQEKVIWHEHWNGFDLIVVKDETTDGFIAVVNSPIGGGEARRSILPIRLKDDAIRRCWGLIRQICEVIASKAAEKMREV